MPILVQTERLEARQREITQEIGRLQEEASELAIALRVIARLESDSPTQPSPLAPASLDEDAPKLGPPRPSGCPTNFQMVDMILASAEKEGKDGLIISEIISEMRARYWPGLKDAQVSAPIYSFVRQDRLRKTPGGKFKRIRQPDIASELALSSPEQVAS
jgi:hypothetical protein